MRREKLTGLFGIGVLVMGAGCVTPKDRVSGNAGAASPEPGTRVSLEQKSREDVSSARFFSHTVNNGEVTITKYMGPDGTVAIPSAVNGLPVRAIGDAAFASCTGLTGVTIPDGVTTIGDWAFCNCCGLTGVTIPDSVASIGLAAFYCCSGLREVTLPASVTSMKANPFRGCNRLTSIRVNPTNPVYSSSEDGVVFDKEKTFLFCCPAGKTGNYEIPDRVTRIGESAFQGSNLTSVTVPCSVTDIGTLAFKWCHGLTGVYFKGHVPHHGGRAFEGTPTPTVYYRPGTIGWDKVFGGRPTAVWKP